MSLSIIIIIPVVVVVVYCIEYSIHGLNYIYSFFFMYVLARSLKVKVAHVEVCCMHVVCRPTDLVLLIGKIFIFAKIDASNVRTFSL